MGLVAVWPFASIGRSALAVVSRALFVGTRAVYVFGRSAFVAVSFALFVGRRSAFVFFGRSRPISPLCLLREFILAVRLFLTWRLALFPRGSVVF